MTSPSIVRRATLEDRDEIWRLFKLLYDEQFMFSLSHRKVDYHISRFLDPTTIHADDNGPRGFIGVIGEAGALEAMIMMGLTTFWYSDQITIEEYVTFVDPAHRKSKHAKALIGYAKNMIDSLLPDYPAMRLITGILSVKRTAAKVMLNSRMLQPVGAMFTWPPIPEIATEAIRRLYHNKQYNLTEISQKD